MTKQSTSARQTSFYEIKIENLLFLQFFLLSIRTVLSFFHDRGLVDNYYQNLLILFEDLCMEYFPFISFVDYKREIINFFFLI